MARKTKSRQHRWIHHGLLALFYGLVLALGVCCGACMGRDRKVTELPSPSAAPTATATVQQPTAAPPQGEFLMLVSAEHPLMQPYTPTLRWLNNGRNCVDERIYADLSAMLTAGTEEGLSFLVVSGYRPREKQEELFEAKVQRLRSTGMSEAQAQEEAARHVQKPGNSEHETGLALDITASAYQELEIDQENTPEIRWLCAHCAEYGFILRYPEGKEAVTGVTYEPWHFRYVGKEAAAAIMGRGITLEEYLAGE